MRMKIGKQIFLDVGQRNIPPMFSGQGFVERALSFGVLEHGHAQGPGAVIVNGCVQQMFLKLGTQMFEPA